MRIPLPRNPYERALELVRRSAPSTTYELASPLVPDDARQELRKAANLRAEQYASMDDLSDECHYLAEEISSSGVVIDVINEEDDNSLVTSIDMAEDSLADDEAPVYYRASSFAAAAR